MNGKSCDLIGRWIFMWMLVNVGCYVGGMLWAETGLANGSKLLSDFLRILWFSFDFSFIEWKVYWIRVAQTNIFLYSRQKK